MRPWKPVLAAQPGDAPARERIVEVGHLAAARAGEGRRLILLLGPHLAGRASNGSSARSPASCATCSFASASRPLILGTADPVALGDEAAHWGSYYEHRPLVLAGHLPQALRHLSRPAAGWRNEAVQLTAMAVALDDGHRRWSVSELDAAVSAFADRAAQPGRARSGHLAGQLCGLGRGRPGRARAAVVHVPLPVFFTPGAIAHALRATGADAVLTQEAAAQRWPQAPAHACTVAGERLTLLRLPGSPVVMPWSCRRARPRSRSLPAPRARRRACACAHRRWTGSRAGWFAPWRRWRSDATCARCRSRCCWRTSPALSAPLVNGTTCVVLPLAQLGLAGSSGFDPAAFQAAVLRLRPTASSCCRRCCACGRATWRQRASVQRPA